MRVWLAAVTLGVGGAERMVVSLAHGLVARGHAVAVSGGPGPFDAELDGTGAERFVTPDQGRRPAGVIGGTGELARGLRRWRPDVVHAQNARLAAVAAAATRLATPRARPPVVASFHGVAPSRLPAAARALRLADVVAPVSADLAAALTERGFPPGRLEVVPNAAPPPVRLAPDQENRLAAELRDGDGPLVVAVGRLVDQKRHARLLDAVSRLGSEHLGARFVIAGTGPLRPSLEARARALGIDDRVRFLGLRPDARALLAHADLVVFSSDFEGMSLAALEALAAGTPVVTTPVAGMRELLGDGAGIVAEACTAEALTAALAAALGDPERRRAMARAAREAGGRRTEAAMIDAYLQVYARAIQSR